MKVGKSPAELGTMPVGKLLVSYSLPPIAAMMASSVYNIIDSAFLGHSVGDYAADECGGGFWRYGWRGWQHADFH